MRLCAIEETGFWSKDVQKRAGRLFAVYVYDETRVTHCCEITPSFELNLIGTVSTEPMDDELWEDINTGDRQNEQVRYVHCAALPKLTRWMDKPLDVLGCDPEETSEQHRVRLVEYLQANDNSHSLHIPTSAFN